MVENEVSKPQNLVWTVFSQTPLWICADSNQPGETASTWAGQKLKDSSFPIRMLTHPYPSSQEIDFRTPGVGESHSTMLLHL